MMLRQLTFLIVSCQSVLSILDPDFLNSIRNTYGDKRAIELNRADLGPNGDGSFGGNLRIPQKRRPVIMIHGLRNKAGYLWANRKVLQDNGWVGEHVVATSWGSGDQGVWEAMKETMKCDYVKQVRNMILATVNHFHSEVDIMAFSMGSPITRKAILGGHCVDTNEWLGEPLTKHVNTFLSVAGANRGSSLCNFTFPGLCEIKAGLNCLSAFIRDINAKEGYEGRHRYYLYSTADEVIGTFNACGEKSASIKGAEEVVLNGLNHEDTMFKALPEQLNIMLRHQ